MIYDRVTDPLPFDVPISSVEMEYASKRGQEVHKAVQYYEEGRLDPDSVGEVVRPYFKGWQNFRVAVNWSLLRMFAIEFEITSDLYGLKGRPDFLGLLDGFPSILDLKSGPPPKPNTWPLQLAAYERITLDEMKAGTMPNPFGKVIPLVLKRVVVQVSKDESYRLHSGPAGSGCHCCDFSPSDFAIYNAYLTVYRYEKKEGV